jgi:hypothetical protein
MMNTGTMLLSTEEITPDDFRFRFLDGLGFVRAKTADHQWYLLVTDAFSASQLPLNEMVRDYLVTMFVRFTLRAELFEQLAAFDYYQYVLGSKSVDPECLHDVADISLQYVALFPERSSNRHQPRSLEQVVNIGIALYKDLAKDSQGKDDWFSKAYTSMSTSFWLAVMVLRSMMPKFIQQTKITDATSISAEAVRLLSNSEACSTASALHQFDNMYFADNVLSTKKN